MDHLVCFLAGTLALGAQTTDDKERADRDLKTAKVTVGIAFFAPLFLQQGYLCVWVSVFLLKKGNSRMSSLVVIYVLLRRSFSREAFFCFLFFSL